MSLYRAPDTLDATTRLVYAQNGELWVQQPGFPWNGARVWDVYTDDGHLRGSVVTPHGLLTVTAVGDDYILGIHLTDDWIQTVRLYPLKEKGREGPPTQK